MSCGNLNREAQKAIDTIREKCESIKPEIVVKCLTFNHGKYIRQTLEGFINQNTDFPFVVVVHDDASTDDTPQIIEEFRKKYPHIIFPIYEKINQYSKKDGSLSRIMNEAIDATGAPYIATCEGDDYWIDENKLQTQRDFLVNNPDYGLVATHCYQLMDGKLEDFALTDQEEISTLHLFEKNRIATLTTLYRHELLHDYRRLNVNSYKFPLGDYPLWLYISQKTKIKNLPVYTAVYRILPESASHSGDEMKNFLFKIAFSEIKILFASHYPEWRRKALRKRQKTILRYSWRLKKLHLLKHLFKFTYLNNGHSQENI